MAFASEFMTMYRVINVVCRLLALWFVFIASASMLFPIFALIIVDPAAGNTMYFIQMIIGCVVTIAIGVVALKVRSFRPDLPRPTEGQSTDWWTGDLTTRVASKGLGPRLSPLLRLVLALVSLPALPPLIVVLSVYGVLPIEVTGLARSDATLGVGVAAGAILVVCWVLSITGRNPFHRE